MFLCSNKQTIENFSFILLFVYTDKQKQITFDLSIYQYFLVTRYIVQKLSSMKAVLKTDIQKYFTF